MSKIRIGICGPGIISHRFVKGALLSPEVCITAVGGRNIAKVTAFAQQYDIPYIYDSYETLCQSEHIDLVYVATPPEHHYPWIIAALEANKHVICEKPMFYSLKDTEIAFALAKQRGLFLMEGQKAIFLPTTQQIKSWIESGVLGEIKYIEASYGYHFKSDWSHWVFDPNIGGGAMFDVGVYPLSVLFYLIEEKITDFSAHFQTLETGCDGFSSYHFQFESGLIANIQGAIALPMNNELRIYGTLGKIILNDFWKASYVEASLHSGEKLVFEVTQPSEFTHYINHSAKCIKKGLTESPISSMQLQKKMLQYLLTSK